MASNGNVIRKQNYSFRESSAVPRIEQKLYQLLPSQISQLQRADSRRNFLWAQQAMPKPNRFYGDVKRYICLARTDPFLFVGLLNFKNFICNWEIVSQSKTPQNIKLKTRNYFQAILQIQMYSILTQFLEAKQSSKAFHVFTIFSQAGVTLINSILLEELIYLCPFSDTIYQ